MSEGESLYDEKSERYALALILNNPDLFNQVNHEKFYPRLFSRNRLHLASAVKSILEENRLPDVATVDDHLTRHMPDVYESWGGLPKLHDLMMDVPYGDVSFIQIIDRLEGLHKRREMKRIGSSLEALADNQALEPEEGVTATHEELMQLLSMDTTEETFFTYNAAQEKFLESLAQKITIPPGTVLGTPSGYKSVDNLLQGFQPGQMIILAARPAMGKTSAALEIAANCALDLKKPAVMFTLEMNSNELMQRLISLRAMVPHEKIKQGKLSENDWAKVSKAWEETRNSPLYIEENPHITMHDIVSKCMRVYSTEGSLGAIIIDYIQLMGNPSQRKFGDSRQEEISQISRGLKILAKDFDVPVIALSQLNRNLENRPNKRPMLSDLRESGALEQDADVVWFIYRDEIYYATTADQGITEFIISKNRHGPSGTVRMGFLHQYTSFKDLAKTH